MMLTDEWLQRHCWRTIIIERREEGGNHDHNDAYRDKNLNVDTLVVKRRELIGSDVAAVTEM